MPSIALPVSLRGQLLSGVRGFSPSSLFILSEPGVWYDPSDLTTLFTDSAGTTPVTTPGDRVGLMLDKSKGLGLGPELVVNGDFSGGSTGWILGTGWAVSGGAAAFTTGSSGGLFQSTTLSASKRYRVTFEKTGIGACQIRFGTGGQVQATISNQGTISAIIQPDSTSFIGFYGDNAGSFTIDNISVRELPGFHAAQSTNLSARPTYGIVPLGGRRNLLTFTEQFENAGWGKFLASVAANTSTAPDGTLTADTITASSALFANVTQSIALTAGATYRVSFYAKAGTSSRSGIGIYDNTGGDFQGRLDFNWASGVPSTHTTSGTVTSPTYTSVGDGWYRISFSTAADATNTAHIVYFYADPAAGTGTVLIWGAQLELGSTASAYQRVGSVYDVTESGVQSLSYLSFDGVDDFMVTPTITPGIDKAQIFAGVRKLSDANASITELSTNGTSANGSFTLVVFDVGRYGCGSRGTVAATAISATNSSTPPITSVLTGIGDVAGDNATLRTNGTQVAQVTTDQGTGNYLAYPMYIGRRGGTSLPFNGNLFSLITRFGANLDTTAITNTETWVGDKTGVNIANLTSPTIFARDDTALLDRFNATIERRA